ncbi:MAG: hypothetical protein O7F73_17085 [Gammaproteobacteria bacterium]|nr:hypothetical protein [Gammaproteobacteria bacterium]
MAEKVKGMKETELAAVRQHVERILNSQALVQAERLRRFLQYLVDHAISEQTGSLNQFSIATDVFDRDESFDPTVDAIVRVEAGRLRSKLLEYYDDEGREDKVRISFPKRGYAVRFQFPESQTHLAPTELETPEAHPDILQPTEVRNAVIAVLPFDNMSTDPEQEYFSDGITEDLITDLSQLPGLSVIARQSTFVYKGSATNAQAVSARLGAEFIVEGSVRKIGNRIRINAQLIHGATGRHIWAERFDRETNDIFDLQDSVNRKIVAALKLQISTANQSRLQRRGTRVIEAYDYLLRGMKEAQMRTREGAERARYCFESALELDPGYATAYGRLSLNTVYQWIGGWNLSREDTIEKGVELAEKGVALDGENAFVNAALCWALLWQGQHDAAIETGQKAIILDPNDVAALERLAFALAWSNRADEALQNIAKAQMLNPLHGYYFPSGVCYFMQAHYAAAVETLHHSIDANPHFLPAYLYLAASLSLLEQDIRARPIAKTIKELDPDYRPADIHRTIFKYTKDRDRFISALTRVLEA